MSVNAPLSDVAIANMAIDVLDDDILVSLSDDTTVGRWMNRNYGYVRDEVLEKYPWNFAKRRRLIPALEKPPEFGWDYQYELPSDCIKPLEIRTGGLHNAPPVPFEHEEGVILTNHRPPIPLIYTGRVTDPTRFTPLFARVLAMQLALYAAHSITGKSSYVQKASNLLSEAWEQARLSQSLSAGTPQSQNRHDIIAIRGRGL